MTGDVYDLSVFVNCPFDEQYRPLFRALVFAIHYCGFSPRCALEVDDSGATRVGRIVDLIRGSRYGIHDLSRVEASDGLPRFNMPFELGLFLGCKHAGGAVQKRKAALVLDSERYRFQKLLSDIAGQDIRHHRADPMELIRQVRHWLRNQSDRDLPGGSHICGRYAEFLSDAPSLLEAVKKTEDDLDNFRDYSRFVYDWVKSTAPAA
jgi:hypothetical protein